MKVTVLEPSGYCSGVERAMKLAIETKDKNPAEKVVVLGMLVHNQDSLKTLEKHGIKTIYKENCSYEQLANEIKEPSTVILTAHGHSKAVEEKLIKNGHKIVDATCPFVTQSHKDMIKAIKDDKDIFYLGKKNHPESIAALSISSRVHLIEVDNPNIPSIECKNPLIISQTTFSIRDIQPIIDSIKSQYPNSEIKKTGICYASDQRQEALLSLDKNVDLIYVVGGKLSNNTKTLYRLALSNYPNAKVLMIENKNDINEKDLIGLNHIAISSGASTPEGVILDIKARIESIND